MCETQPWQSTGARGFRMLPLQQGLVPVPLSLAPQARPVKPAKTASTMSEENPVRKIKVEKGQIANRRRRNRYPWDSMKKGDSFWCQRAASTVLSAAIGYAQRNFPGRRYTTRKERNGTRIWRVK